MGDWGRVTRVGGVACFGILIFAMLLLAVNNYGRSGFLGRSPHSTLCPRGLLMSCGKFGSVVAPLCNLVHTRCHHTSTVKKDVTLYLRST